jgi:hypothetical protein
MLGFIATGLKLLGRIVVKIVKAVTIGTVVGVVASNVENIKDAGAEIGKDASKEFTDVWNKTCEDQDRPTKKETIKMIPYAIRALVKLLYGIYLLLLCLPLIVINGLLNAVTIIFKNKKEEK